MVYSLLFSLPGTPVLFYGEEIGMGEDLDLEGRMAVRTPMQWTAGRNGGFSGAPPRRLRRPVVSGGFAPEFVNVADQRRDPDSLLAFMKLLIRRYRESPGAGLGDARRSSTSRTRRCSRTPASGTTARWSPSTTSGAEPRTVPLTLDGLRLHAPAGRPAAGRQHAGVGHGRGGARARGLRLPLAAGGERGQPATRLERAAPRDGSRGAAGSGRQSRRGRRFERQGQDVADVADGVDRQHLADGGRDVVQVRLVARRDAARR